MNPNFDFDTLKQRLLNLLEYLKKFVKNHWLFIVVPPLLAGAAGYYVYKSYFSSRFRNSKIQKDEKFDFIIVGAGSAGSCLAHRLSENPNCKVLLLEAGGTDNVLEVKLPAGFAKLFKTEVDWSYFTEEQKNCFDRKLLWPRGKMMGGSSNMNAMIYHRCHSSDFDEFGKENDGWSFKDVLPYFIKMENNTGKNLDEKYHGKGGPMFISDQVETHEITKQIVETFKQNGTEFTTDINGKKEEGVVFFQVNQKNGQRFSTADGYLSTETLKRKNLKVQYKALVSKILFDNGVAIGVEFSVNGTKRVALSSKEVLLSGGSINSPQLLLLSGVGPKDDLKKVGVTPIHQLNGVGKNLQDHIFYTICCQSTLPSVHTEESLGTVFQWATKGKGPLTSNLAEFASFERTSKSTNSDAPNIEYIGGPLYFIAHGGKAFEKDGITIGPVLLHPKSSGYIKLKSNNPKDHPIIQPNYFENTDDLDAMVEAYKRVEQIYDSNPLKKYVKELKWPEKKPQSDDEIAKFIKQTCETLYHPTSTCKMGPKEDKLSVVDATLKVHGLKGIRVVDASIFPRIPSGHTQAPTIMVAEKAADLIKAEWNI